MSTETQKVDVLAVMLRAIETIDPDVTLSPSQIAVDMEKARAAVAELIEAAEFASNVCAELYAKYQIKIGPFASQAQVANGKLRAALARVGGAK